MRIYPLLTPDFLTNTYLVSDENGEAVVIDPGKISQELISLIEDNHLSLRAVLLTSSAPEHSAGVGTLGKIYSFKVFSFASGLRDGDCLEIGQLSFKVRHVPGHALDVIAYYLNGEVVFTGDSLLSGARASTSSYLQRALLARSVMNKLMMLPEDVFIYPGQGPLSRVRAEKLYNLDLLELEASFPGKGRNGGGEEL